MNKWTEEEKGAALGIAEKHPTASFAEIDAAPERELLMKRTTKQIADWIGWQTKHRFKNYKNKTTMKKKHASPVLWTDEEKELALNLAKKHTVRGRVQYAALEADPERQQIKRATATLQAWLRYTLKGDRRQKGAPAPSVIGSHKNSRQLWTREHEELILRLMEKYRSRGGKVDRDAVINDPEVAKLPYSPEQVSGKLSRFRDAISKGKLQAPNQNGDNVGLVPPFDRAGYTPSDFGLPPAPAEKKLSRNSIGAQAYIAWSIAMNSAVPWDTLVLAEQEAWRTAAMAVQPEPVEAQKLPNFCPGCGTTLHTVIMAMNLKNPVK